MWVKNGLFPAWRNWVPAAHWSFIITPFIYRQAAPCHAMQWDKISTPGCRNSGYSPSAELQMEPLSTSLHNWKLWVSKRREPGSQVTSMAQPQTPRFKAAGTKIYQDCRQGMIQHSVLQKKNRLWPFVTPLVSHQVPKHCLNMSSPAPAAASPALLGASEGESTAQPLQQLFISFPTLRHIWEWGEVKWKDKWNTAIFLKASPFCVNFEWIPYALACCFDSLLRYYLQACLSKAILSPE